MRLNVGLSLLAVGVCWTSAHAQDLSAFRATFEGSLAEIEATCTQRSSALGAPYLRSVEALYEQSRGAGDLAGALAAKAELDRARATGSPPDTLSEHAGVAALQAKYQQAVRLYQTERARQTAGLADQYDQALDKLQRSHVMEEALDQAQSVQKERERAKALPAITNARQTLADAAEATPPLPAVVSVADKPTPATPPVGTSARFTMKDAKDVIEKMDKLSEQDWRKLPGSVVAVEADPSKVCDTGTTLGPGDAVLLVPHPRDGWTPWAGRVEECDFRGLQGGVGGRRAGPRIRVGDFSPMALCGVVGRGFPFPVENNYLVTGQGKLDLSPGPRAIRLEGGQPRGSIRVKIIPVGE